MIFIPFQIHNLVTFLKTELNGNRPVSSWHFYEFLEGSNPVWEVRSLVWGGAKPWEEHLDVPGDAPPDECGGSVSSNTLPPVGAGGAGGRVARPSNKAKIRKNDRTIWLWMWETKGKSGELNRIDDQDEKKEGKVPWGYWPISAYQNIFETLNFKASFWMRNFLHQLNLIFSNFKHLFSFKKNHFLDLMSLWSKENMTVFVK
jgi:hypothetical protein